MATPLVVAGDLNSTRFRPEFKELLDTGVDRQHRRARPGVAPVVLAQIGVATRCLGAIARIDHALVNEAVRSLKVKNLPPRAAITTRS